MGVKVRAVLGEEKYHTEVTAGDNKLITDEPIDKGGRNKGFNPYEILATALASCTAATLRMYIDRKGWLVPKIHVEVEFENYPSAKSSTFIRVISYENADLNEEQLNRLHSIAEACPVHKLLHGNIDIKTTFEEGR